MASGLIASGGSDLDDIFASGNAGFDAGFVAAGGQNVGNRYAPLSYGSMAAATGFIRVSTDLNQYFASKASVGPLWPVGGGFTLGANGLEQFVFPGITALFGKFAWRIQNVGNSYSDAGESSPNANRNTLCPGAVFVNANSWTDFGGFNRGVAYTLPPGAVLRFGTFTDNISGTYNVDRTIAAGDWSPGWANMHNGGIPLCSSAAPFVSDPQNIFDFSPGLGSYFGMYVPWMNWVNGNNWTIRIGAAFCCNKNDGYFNVIRTSVTRIA